MAVKKVKNLSASDLIQILKMYNLEPAKKKSDNLEILKQHLIENEFVDSDEVNKHEITFESTDEEKSREMFAALLSEQQKALSEQQKALSEEQQKALSEQQGAILTVVEDIRDKMADVSSRVDKMKQKEEQIASMKSEIKKQITEQIENILQQQPKGAVGQPLAEPRNSGTQCVQWPSFSGQDDWTAFKRRFEAAAMANGVTTEEKKMAILIARLDGPAASVLDGIQAPLTYMAIIGALDVRYGNHHMQEVFKAQISDRRRRPGETLQELAADIQSVARLAYPAYDTNAREDRMIEIFIAAIEDAQLKVHLKTNKKTTMTEVLALALNFEAATASSIQTPHVQRMASVQETPRQASTESWQHRGREAGPRQNWQPSRCYNCNQPGHSRRDCPQPIQSVHRQQYWRRNGANQYQEN